MSIYEKYKSRRSSWGIDVLGSVICEIELSNGVCGAGISIGGEPACYLIEKHYSRFLIGQDPMNVEYIWDCMYRSSMNYGRKGITIQTISSVDLALWDCIGKLLRQPVYKLLGGQTKGSLPCYATCYNPAACKKLGFVGAKFTLPYGPGMLTIQYYTTYLINLIVACIYLQHRCICYGRIADGDIGMRKNIERVKSVRDSVGAEYPLMIDCYMALTTTYTIELLHQLKPYNIKWVEEFLPPDSYSGYTEVKQKNPSSTLLTTGEHEYTRWGFKQLLEGKCADLLQPGMNINHNIQLYVYEVLTNNTYTYIYIYIYIHP